MGKKIAALMLPIMGVLFISAYIRSSTTDIIYTDYIRLINAYFPDVYSFKPYLGTDIFTRLPITYVERVINVGFFAYSTFFDMMLGAVFLGIGIFIIAWYALKKNMELWEIILLVFIGFSLNKWEMISNGSGWVHFLAFALFFYHYYVYDRYVYGGGRRRDALRLCILPWFTILLAAGPYTAVYAAASLLVYGIYGIKVWKEGRGANKPYLQEKKSELKRQAVFAFNIILPTLLYMLSRAYSVEEHAGATKLSLTQVIEKDPLLLPRLFIKSLASIGLEAEFIDRVGLSFEPIIALGILIGIIYIYALWINLAGGLYKYSVFPLFLVFSGGVSHVLVCLSRWIFLNDTYAMSSRYALQFQAGVLGILLSVYLNHLYRKKEEKQNSRKKERLILLGISLLFMSGTFFVDAGEIYMAEYRKENFIKKEEAALNFESLSDDELNNIFQYRHDASRIRNALGILKEEKLNIFAREGNRKDIPEQ